MITNLILSFVNLVVGWIDGLFPHLSIPSWLSSGSLIPSGAENAIASAFYAISSVYPSSMVLTIFVSVCAIWPAVGAFVVFQFIYRHIPEVFGFGLEG